MAAQTAIQGIGDFIFGGAQRRDQQKEQTRNIQILKTPNLSNEQYETAARKIFQGVSPQKYDEIIAANPDHTFYSPILNRAEKKAKMQDPYGRRYGKGAEKTKQAGDLSLTISRMEKTGMFDDDPGLKENLTNRVKELASPEYRNAKLMEDYGKSSNASEFQGLDPFDEESALGPDVMQFDTSEIQEKGKKPGLLRSTFDTFAEYFQGPTAAVPQANIPQTMSQIGITDTDDQAIFQDLEKAAPPELDLRGIVISDPQGFKKILDALKAGKTPSGKKFTIKDAIEMLQTFQR